MSTDKVDEFIFSQVGHNYIRSIHKVNRWQVAPTGIELLPGGLVSEEDSSLRPPLASSADVNGIVWLYYSERYTGGGIIVVWMSPEGELLNRHLVARDSHTFVAYDMEHSFLTECTYFDATQTLEYNAFSPTSSEPFWSESIADIPAYDFGFIEGRYLYLFNRDDDSVTAVYLGNPVSRAPE